MAWSADERIACESESTILAHLINLYSLMRGIKLERRERNENRDSVRLSP